MSMSVVCPKCGASVEIQAQDTKVVQAYVLCPKCGIVWKVS